MFGRSVSRDVKGTEDLNVNYGSIVGKKEDADVFAAAVRGTVKVEVKMDY